MTAIVGTSETMSESPAVRANSILQSSSYHSIRQVSCSFQNGVLMIDGSLPSFHMKQLAQDALRGIEGVDKIVNRIEVTSR